ncbi:MAG: hypothetical protein QNK23_16730 [Crocinitomicaceae bacterium]|nr:hypothetical protein [Crocinitomicaceae bacterium]
MAEATNITLANLQFATARVEGGLPSIYFIGVDGRFNRVRPYHNHGFRNIQRPNRHIFFVAGDDRYEFQRGATIVANYTGRHVEDYTDHPDNPHNGHNVITPTRAREIYAQNGVHMDNFIAHMAANPDAFYGTAMDDIIGVLAEQFPT